MTTLVEVVAATLTGRRIRRTVYQPEEFPRLITPHSLTAEASFSAWCTRRTSRFRIRVGWVPETVLVVTVCESWGAFYYRGYDHRAWITNNPEPSPDAPALQPV